MFKTQIEVWVTLHEERRRESKIQKVARSIRIEFQGAKAKRKRSSYSYSPPWWFSHPRIPSSSPLYDSIGWGRVGKAVRRVPTAQAGRADTGSASPFPLSSLLAERRAFILFDEAVVLALDPLEPASLACGKLCVEALSHLLPLLPEVDSVVPDKIHFLLVVFGSWWAPTLWNCG